MNVLVLNVGSATVKFQLMRTDQERIEQDSDETLAKGVVERIGGEAVLTLWTEAKGSYGRAPRSGTSPVPSTGS
jgi:acetate kinase